MDGCVLKENSEVLAKCFLKKEKDLCQPSLFCVLIPQNNLICGSLPKDALGFLQNMLIPWITNNKWQPYDIKSIV
ncbi:hypothetical protein IC802_17170 [Geobacillus sp. 44C]|nr:hypothetical protein IC802_17170 [Geobacillus sp. 44C]